MQTKKVSKENCPAAPDLRAALGLPGKSGGCVKLGLWPQTNAADTPRFTRKTEAAQKGIKKRFCGRSPCLIWIPSPPGRAGWGGLDFAVPSPDPPPSSTAGPGGVGEHCLSAWPRSGSRELRSRPARRAAQGTPSGAVDGSRLLWYTFLGEARKVYSRRAAPGNNKTVRMAHPTKPRVCEKFHGDIRRPGPSPFF